MDIDIFFKKAVYDALCIQEFKTITSKHMIRS